MAKQVDELKTLEDFYEYLGIPEDKQMTEAKRVNILTSFKRNLAMSPIDLAKDIKACKEIMLDSVELIELQESGVVIHQKAGGCSSGGGCSGCGNH